MKPKIIKNIIVFLICLILINLYASSQNLKWAKSIGGIKSDRGELIACDNFGNVYTVGNFTGTVDLDPGSGIQFHSSHGGGNVDLFITKMNSLGNLIWAKSLGGDYPDVPIDIAVDAVGNIIVTGTFKGTVDFDPAAGNFKLSSYSITNTYPSGSDIFILKLDSSGNFVWVKRQGGMKNDKPTSISIDISGNVIIAGEYEDSSDFDPGVGEYMLNANGNVFAMFFSKLDVFGNFLWAKGISSKGSEDRGWVYAMSLDVLGNIIATGSYFGSTDFDPGKNVFILNSKGYGDVFILKLNSSGNFIWAKSMGGPNDYFSDDCAVAMDIDKQGNIFTTGYFSSSADFDPGSGEYFLNSTSKYREKEDIFISKLDSSGNFLWAKALPNKGYVSSILADPWGSVYTIGSFINTLDFDPGPGIFDLTASGNTDIFILKLDVQGIFLWATDIGDIGQDAGLSIATNDSGQIYCTGYFSGNPDFDPMVGTYNLPANGVHDVFILKLCAPIALTKSIEGPISLCEGSSATYTLKSSGKAIEYLWNFPAGTVINWGQTSREVNVTFGKTSGFVKLTAVNECGNPGCDSVAVIIHPFPTITNQPVNKETQRNSNAVFSLFSPCLGCAFQWQENSGTGFVNLKNSIRFTGVTNDTLILHNVTLTENNNKYRCLIANGLCIDTSNSASIKVFEFKDEEIIEVFPNPMNSLVNIKIMKDTVLSNFVITDVVGRNILHGELIDELTILNVSNFAQGVYFIHVNGRISKTFKIIRHE